MRIHLFDVGEQAVINQNAISGLPDLVGSLVTIEEQLSHGTYDYIVHSEDRPSAKVREKELNKVNKDRYIFTLILGDKISKANEEEGEIKLIDYLYEQVEIKFPDGSYEVISVNSVLNKDDLE
ncbi:hypothetical protein [Robertmurraya siralis]|uniref:hypothetical protein n=1 Tax=Robertmurraya siralis TaxID=77777 RepID=UPI0010F50809|nr:hypothetical protein [Robertmurraya siralis]